MSGRRALHFVFKVGDRTATAKFYREILGMKFLRHEEFEEGCKATCNGPYDGKWSKSMVGFGPEDSHFVTELTYNYGVKSYDLGNDFLGIAIKYSNAVANAKKGKWPLIIESESVYSVQAPGAYMLELCVGQNLDLPKGITIQCSVAVASAKKAKWPLTIESEGVYSVQAPGGYRFYLVDKPRPAGDPVQRVAIGVSNLQKSVDYWTKVCGMTLHEQTTTSALLGFGEGQCKLELLDQGGAIDHKTAFGRVAFSCPREQLPGIEAASNVAGQTVITPLISLDTPGKATVEVVILADPDGHEICFVGDEAFRELSQVDPKADSLLDEAVAADKSDEWFAKKQAKLGKQWTPGS